MLLDPLTAVNYVHYAAGSTGGIFAQAPYSPTGYAGAVLAQNPQLYWRLNEKSGTTAADLSGHQHVGTYGSSVTLGGTGAMSSDPNTSASFNDTNTAFVSSTYVPFATGGSFTVMGWANRAATTTLDDLFVGSVGSGLTALSIGSAGEGVTFRANAASVVWNTPGWPGLSQWVHWALTYNDATLTAELFLNGVSQGTRTLASGFAGGAGGNFILSSSFGTTNAWSGSMQDAAVWPSVLPSATIAQIYQNSTNYPWSTGGFMELVSVDVQGGSASTTVTISELNTGNVVTKIDGSVNKSYYFGHARLSANAGGINVVLGGSGTPDVTIGYR